MVGLALTPSSEMKLKAQDSVSLERNLSTGRGQSYETMTVFFWTLPKRHRYLLLLKWSVGFSMQFKTNLSF